MTKQAEITVSAELVEKMKAALSSVYARRYEGHEDEDDYLWGYGVALDQVLNELGVEHEQWNPMGHLK